MGETAETVDWTVMLTTNFPTIALIATLAFGVFMIVRFLAGTLESMGGVAGKLGTWLRSRRAINKAESDDMRKRISYLDGQVRALRYRDECYFAYMMTDADWHHDFELVARAKGWAPDIKQHISFLEFRDNWMRQRGLEKEFVLWT
ncbi:hypothetical protein [Mycolicibacterium sphagni]|uniref:Uncharacterized protein n=1 Tax=Mycolicibacterium sphagni TaxID=1786 RepID=A0A255DRM4_9MYCO|nr:hypothetical protein [Mycolicibacterium sphagni]OYN81884.1 hypothetical protein CG716_05485 [Mycolicibacterium sphagni]